MYWENKFDKGICIPAFMSVLSLLSLLYTLNCLTRESMELGRSVA